MHTFDEWKTLVRGSLRLKSDLDAIAIAQHCYVAEREGRPCSTWHMAAQFYGTLCHCVPCTKERELKAEAA